MLTVQPVFVFIQITFKENTGKIKENVSVRYDLLSERNTRTSGSSGHCPHTRKSVHGKNKKRNFISTSSQGRYTLRFVGKSKKKLRS